MKKILFLMLSLAVSASAVAGINAKQVIKAQSGPATKSATHRVKLNNPAPIMDMVQRQQYKAQKQHTTIANLDERYQKQEKFRDGQVVSDQPAGTVKTYNRTGGTSIHRYYNAYSSNPWGGLTYGAQEGTVTVVENGNTYWFKNLVYDPDGYFEDYWIKGTKAGNRIIIQMGQEMWNYGDGSSMVLYMGEVTYDSGLSWTRGTASTAAFAIDGDKLTLQNSEETGQYEGTGLGCDWDDGFGWGGFIDFATELTLSGETPVDPTAPEAPVMYSDDDIIAMAQEGGELEAYARTGDAIVVEGNSLYLDYQGGITYVYFAEDGETVYMRDPVYDWDAGYWTKGTIAGNTITMPLGQYVYWNGTTDNGTLYWGLRTTWGTFANGSGYTADNTITECTYTINEKNIVLNGTSYDEENGIMTGVSLSLDTAYQDLGWYGNLNANTIYWTAPDVPENVTVDPDATTAEVTWDGGNTEEWNLRYRQYNPDAETYFCDFEDYSEWSFADMDGDGKTWTKWTLTDGTQCLTSASYDATGALTPDNWLISPEVALNGVVRFKAWGQDPSWASEVFAVYVTTNPEFETVDDFTELSDGDITALPYDSVNGGVANTYIFDLSAYAGQRGYVAIRHYNITDMFRLNVDDFFVGDADAPIYEWVNVSGITEIPYTIEGLTPETMYEVQVAGVNGGAIGVWTESTIFTTLPEQTVLRGDVDDNGLVNLSDVTTLINHLLSKNWDNVPGQFSYDNSDCDQNGTVNLSDVTALINYLLSKAW